MTDAVTTSGDRPRLSVLFQRLDEILSQLDREDVDLEEQMALYRQACGHLASAREILDETHAEIEFLMGGDGAGPGQRGLSPAPAPAKEGPAPPAG